MNLKPTGLALAMAGALTLTLYGCGGSPGASETVALSTTVIDGAIRNALVCLDKNNNGECEADEPNGRTDANGNLTLQIAKADAGKYPLVTVVGTDAVDADHGPVTEPFTMKSTPGKPGVISPLTTMVAQVMEGGSSEAEAEKSVQEMTGLTVSLFEDFTKKPAPAVGAKPGDVARMIVVATQEQGKKLANVIVGAQDASGNAITGADLKKAVLKKIMGLLPQIAQATQDNAGNTDQKAKEAAVLNAVKSSFMTVEGVKLAVAVDKAPKVADAASAAVTAGASLMELQFTDANNWNRRVLSGSVAQNTLDANGMRRFVDRRDRATSGNRAAWSFGSNLTDQPITFWDGSAWTGFALHFESLSTPVDAAGQSKSSYGPKYSTSTATRSTIDVSGKTMASVVQQILEAGYTNLNITNAASVLGTATFPAESKVSYFETRSETQAFAHNNNYGSRVFQFPDYAGGDTRPGGTPGSCNVGGVSFTSATVQITTLEQLVATYTGTPCLRPEDSIVNGNGTFSSGSPRENWGSTTLGIGTVGTAPLVGQASATAYYTTNTLVRLAFTGPNEASFYLCKQRIDNGSTRNCVATGEKATTSITTLGDGSRVMTFSAMPAAASNFSKRIFVERGGKVYFGFQSRLSVNNTARFNLAAGNALFTQLGIPTIDPEVPLALTAASYQGTWDFQGAAATYNPNVTDSITIGANGSCTQAVRNADNTVNNSVTCTTSMTNPATGAFTYSNSLGATATGTMNFLTGTASGTANNPSATPPVVNVPLGAGRR
jgi:trimeric autotransporter adhesin